MTKTKHPSFNDHLQSQCCPKLNLEFTIVSSHCHPTTKHGPPADNIKHDYTLAKSVQTSNPNIRVGVGIYPTEGDSDTNMEELKYLIEDVLPKVIESTKAVHIWEIGLDDTKTGYDQTKQLYLFGEQTKLASELKLLILFHF